MVYQYLMRIARSFLQSAAKYRAYPPKQSRPCQFCPRSNEEIGYEVRIATNACESFNLWKVWFEWHFPRGKWWTTGWHWRQTKEYVGRRLGRCRQSLWDKEKAEKVKFLLLSPCMLWESRMKLKFVRGLCPCPAMFIMSDMSMSGYVYSEVCFEWQPSIITGGSSEGARVESECSCHDASK